MPTCKRITRAVDVFNDLPCTVINEGALRPQKAQATIQSEYGFFCLFIYTGESHPPRGVFTCPSVVPSIFCGRLSLLWCRPT